MNAVAPLLVLDAPMLVFQAYFGVPDEFHDPKGRSVNAVIGFARRLAAIIRLAPGMKVLACWDESLGTGFRHRLFAGYKAQRPAADDAFLFQIEACMTLLKALGIAQTGSREFEADDLMATALAHQRAAGGRSVVVSHDKDLAQVIRGDDQLWRHPRHDPAGEAVLAGEWGFSPARIADYLALCGDASDNIPGLPGIGATTARALMVHFDGLADLYARLDEVTTLPLRGARQVRDTLERERDLAHLFLQLTRLREDAFDATEWASKGQGGGDAAAVAEHLGSLGLAEALKTPMVQLLATLARRVPA